MRWYRIELYVDEYSKDKSTRALIIERQYSSMAQAERIATRLANKLDRQMGFSHVILRFIQQL